MDQNNFVEGTQLPRAVPEADTGSDQSTPAPEVTRPRSRRLGALLHSLVAIPVGAVTIYGVTMMLLFGTFGGLTWLVWSIPLLPVLVFWGLDAMMNRPKHSLWRGLFTGILVVIVFFTLVPLLSAAFEFNVMTVLALGAVTGALGVLLSRLGDFFRRSSS